MDNLLQLRFIAFIVGFILFSLLQFIIPRRAFMENRWLYSLSNFCLIFINNLALFVIIIIPLKASLIGIDNGFGLFNIFAIPIQYSTILSLVILDLVIYTQHYMFHKIKFLSRFHKVHHIDPMLDTTSGFRFHFVEIILSNFIKVFIVFIFGIQPVAIVLFEIILNVTAMFNHSNIKIHPKLEQLLRIVLVTPDLHLIHHSVIKSETNSNYGFSVIWWDKIFKTYTPEPKEDYAVMKLGVKNMPDKKYILFPHVLIYPFIKKTI